VISQTTVPAHNMSNSAYTQAAGITNGVARSDLTIPRGYVTATLNFYKAPEDGSIPFMYVVVPPEGQPRNNYNLSATEVRIHDIRGHIDEFNLEKEAFQVIENVPESAEKDFVSDESIKKNYYPEVEKLLLEHTPGGQRVVIFDHTVRRCNPSGPTGGGPVLQAHVDQTPANAKERVKRHAGEKAEELLKGRYHIINVWRPLNGPVIDTPLAFAPSSSADDKDIIPVEHRFSDWTGQTGRVRYNEGQKWHYLSGMRNDERLL
jgi:hypothetical protein